MHSHDESPTIEISAGCAQFLRFADFRNSTGCELSSFRAFWLLGIRVPELTARWETQQLKISLLRAEAAKGFGQFLVRAALGSGILVPRNSNSAGRIYLKQGPLAGVQGSLRIWIEIEMSQDSEAKP